jgi:hypothetical protein
VRGLSAAGGVGLLEGRAHQPMDDLKAEFDKVAGAVRTGHSA